MTTLEKKADYSLYANAFGFLRQPLDFDPVNSDAEWIVTGVPFDLATTGRSGSRFGPEAIRKASINLAWESKRWPWGFRLTDHLSMADCGDLVFEAGNATELSESLQLHTEAVLAAGKKMLTLGGDHFITLPLLRAHARQFGPLSLIHFDAHTDDDDQGGEFDHGTMFYHAIQEGLINPEVSVQIGIRTYHNQEKTPFRVFDAGYVNETPVNEIIEQIHRTIAHHPAYLTFDIDCLDPAYAPGTGTPVCGGLTSNRALQLVRGLQGLDIVGMDVVEVAPAYDSSDITALAAATVALDLLYLQACKKTVGL